MMHPLSQAAILIFWTTLPMMIPHFAYSNSASTHLSPLCARGILLFSTIWVCAWQCGMAKPRGVGDMVQLTRFQALFLAFHSSES